MFQCKPLGGRRARINTSILKDLMVIWIFLYKPVKWLPRKTKMLRFKYASCAMNTIKYICI